MVDHGGKTELISVTDAAKRLGVHRNTIDGRCAKGIYVWEWAEGPKGRQKFIHVASLANTEPVTDAQPANAERRPAAAPGERGLAEQVLAKLEPVLAEIRAQSQQNTRLLEQLRDAARGNVQMIREMREVALENGQLAERCADLTAQVERLELAMARQQRDAPPVQVRRSLPPTAPRSAWSQRPSSRASSARHEPAAAHAPAKRRRALPSASEPDHAAPGLPRLVQSIEARRGARTPIKRRVRMTWRVDVALAAELEP